jgi:hypothetical protein
MPNKKGSKRMVFLTEEELDGIGSRKKQAPENLYINWLLKVACQNP